MLSCPTFLRVALSGWRCFDGRKDRVPPPLTSVCPGVACLGSGPAIQQLAVRGQRDPAISLMTSKSQEKFYQVWVAKPSFLTQTFQGQRPWYSKKDGEDLYKVVLLLEAANIRGGYWVPGPGLWVGPENNPTWYSPKGLWEEGTGPGEP